MVTKIVPFVSSSTINEFVDEYVEGKHQNINIKKLYPFMSREAISKLFDYLSEKEWKKAVRYLNI